MRKFKNLFRKLADPRAANARHELWEILFIALAAVLCGAKSCCEFALFGRSKEAFLRELLALEHGIPSHDTFSRVFRLLDPTQFHAAFLRFMQDFAAAAEGVIAIDGKTLRRSFDKAAKARISDGLTNSPCSLSNAASSRGVSDGSGWSSKYP